MIYMNIFFLKTGYANSQMSAQEFHIQLPPMLGLCTHVLIG